MKTIAIAHEKRTNKISLDMYYGPMDAIAAGDTARLTLIKGSVSDHFLSWLEGDKSRPIDGDRVVRLLEAFVHAALRTGWNPSVPSADKRLLRFGLPDGGAILEIWAWIQPYETNRAFFEIARHAGGFRRFTPADN